MGEIIETFAVTEGYLEEIEKAKEIREIKCCIQELHDRLDELEG